jgi:hypothetical protein
MAAPPAIPMLAVELIQAPASSGGIASARAAHAWQTDGTPPNAALDTAVAQAQACESDDLRGRGNRDFGTDH